MNDKSTLGDKRKMIDRVDEVKELQSLLKSVEEGEGETAFIAGEPGVGKSHLVDRIKKVALRRGFEVLRGACEVRAAQPYLPFQQIWSDSQKDELDSLSFIIDEDDLLEEKEDVKTYREYRGVAFYETTEQMREVVTETPHLIVIENLHWADKATLNLFHYLADRLQDAQVLFLATYQPGEAVSGSSFAEMKQQMSRKDLFTEVELKPFNFEQTRELVEDIIGVADIPSSFLDILYKKTEGNPLFIEESIHQMIESGVVSLDSEKFPEEEEDFSFPGPIEDVVERRIFRLNDTARKTLQLGSVIGKSIPFSLLLEASSLDEFDLLDEIDKLVKGKLWIEDPDEDKFLFSHELIAETIYDGIGKWVERKGLHLDVAEALEQIYEDEIEEWYPQLAEHYKKGEEYRTALDYYLKAGQRAKNVYASEDALRMYKKAEELSTHLPEEDVDKVMILEEMADAYRLEGGYEKSQDQLYKALGMTLDSKEEQKIYLDIISNWQEHGEFEKALELAEKRLSLEEENTLERCQLLGKKGWSLMQLGKYDEAMEAFGDEKEAAEDIGDEKEMGQAYHNLGSLALMRRKNDEALEYLEQAKEIRERIDDQMGLSKTLSNMSGVFAYKGDLDKALEEYQRCLDIYEDMGAKVHIGGIHNNIGLVYQKKGEAKKALEHLREGYELGEKMNNKFIMCHTVVNIGEVYRDVGEYDKALNYLKEGVRLAGKTGHLDKKVQAERVFTEVELERGNVDGAADHVKSLARATSDRDVERDKGLISYLKGMVYRKKGSLDKSVEEFEEAMEVFDEMEPLDLRGMCLYQFGLTWNEKGDEEKAEEYLEEAMEYLEERGMELWMEKCEEALKESNV
ncbi:MAG: BREX system ATP-binding domain-containing protein [Candidatus Aenigmatarchaeota archaeon]